MEVVCVTSGNPLTGFQATALYRKQTASGNNFTHKEVSDNIAFSDQERLSSENRSCRFIVPHFLLSERQLARVRFLAFRFVGQRIRSQWHQACVGCNTPFLEAFGELPLSRLPIHIFF
jgi:hypothetical protein